MRPCSLIAKSLGLTEGRDYVRVCMGENGFADTVYDLSEYMNMSKVFRPAEYCDISAQTLTVTADRQTQLGIQFSRATFRGSLAVLIYAPVHKPGLWAFMRPLEWKVWIMLLATIPIVPFMVIFFEATFSGRCARLATTAAATGVAGNPLAHNVSSMF
jgi:hypothetical protein